jgi:hypothetical protein
MDIRQQRRLEEQRSRNMRKIESHLDNLDRLYGQSIRDKDNLAYNLHHRFQGGPYEYKRALGKMEQNILDFEQVLRRKQRYFEEEKRKISRDFEKRMRQK